MTNRRTAALEVACPQTGCHAAANELCVEGNVLLRHTWHRSREILAQSSADDLDPLDFQATITVRTVVGTAAPGDLSVFRNDPVASTEEWQRIFNDEDDGDDVQTGRNE